MTASELYPNLQGQAQKLFTPNETAMLLNRDIYNYFYSVLEGIWVGQPVNNVNLADIKLYMGKAWKRYEFTNLGNFPTHVEAYVLYPRRNISSLELANCPQILTKMVGNTTDLGGESAQPTAPLQMPVPLRNFHYGISPYLFTDLRENFHIKKKFAALMPPGSVGNFTLKSKGRTFNRLVYEQTETEFDTDWIWKQTRVVLWRIWTVPVGVETPLDSGNYHTVTGPFKIGVIADEWWKSYTNRAEGWMNIYTENWAPVSNSVNMEGPEYMNPDTGAPQTFNDAGD